MEHEPIHFDFYEMNRQPRQHRNQLGSDSYIRRNILHSHSSHGDAFLVHRNYHQNQLDHQETTLFDTNYSKVGSSARNEHPYGVYTKFFESGVEQDVENYVLKSPEMKI